MSNSMASDHPQGNPTIDILNSPLRETNAHQDGPCCTTEQPELQPPHSQEPPIDDVAVTQKQKRHESEMESMAL